MSFLANLAAVLIILVLLNAMMAGGALNLNGDDTDLYQGGKVVKRSGMMIVTDHGTGVQYLSIPMVGLTPRLDANGKVMVAKAGEQ